jgi:hypothetical protein
MLPGAGVWWPLIVVGTCVDSRERRSRKKLLVVETRLDTTQGAAGDDDNEVTGGLKHKPNQQNSYAESSP